MTLTHWPDYDRQAPPPVSFDVQGAEIIYDYQPVARLTVQEGGSLANEFIEELRDAVTLAEAARMEEEEGNRQHKAGEYEGACWGLERVDEVLDALEKVQEAMAEEHPEAAKWLDFELDGLNGRLEEWKAENESDRPEST